MDRQSGEIGSVASPRGLATLPFTRHSLGIPNLPRDLHTSYHYIDVDGTEIYEKGIR